MKRLLTILVFLMVVISSQKVAATDYYFSSVSGNDSRTAIQAQNPNTPWKSIEKLNAIMQTLKPGDAIFFRKGEVFYGTIHITKSGASAKPIKFSAYGTGAKPVITSLVAIKDWKSIGGGKYETKVPSHVSKVNVALMNNKILELGRYPNSDAENEGYLIIDAVSGNNMIKSGGISGSPNWKGGEVVIKKNQWVIDVQQISSHAGASIGYKNGSNYPAKKDWGFFVQNHIQTLDKEGEWYFDASRKKMNIYMGSKNPSSYNVEVATLDHLLTKNYGASHILIDNLHFKGSNSDAINIAGGNNIKFNQVEIESAGGDGLLSLSVLDLVVENSKVINAYNNGFSLNYGNDGAIIRNSIVENIGAVAGRSRNSDGNGIGILAKTDNTLIEGNVVRNIGYSGIHFGGNNTVVKNNFVENTVLVKGDGGGIYSYGGASTSKFTNRKVINNIVINSKGSWGGIPKGINFKPLAEGIFLDDNTSGVEIAGNTVAHVTNNALKMSNVSDIIVRDNTFFDGSALLNIGNNELGRDSRNVTVKNNLFFSKYPDQSSYRILSRKNDVAQMGDFNNNYFFRPLGDDFSIQTRYEGNSGTIEKEEDLERWQKSFGKDKNSKSHTVAVEKFKVVKHKSSNLFDNGNFNSNISGINPSGGKASWSSNKLNGGTLQMSTGQKSSILLKVGNLKKGKAYLVEFSGLSDKKGAVKAYFRYHQTPWEQVSPSTTFSLNSTQSKYKTVLTPYEDVEGAVLIISSVDANFTYWMDDLQIREVELNEQESENRILFEYNAGKSPKTIKLDATYVDAKNREYSGSVTIAPFSSVVLVKTSTEDVEEEIKASVPSVQLSLPSGSTNFVEGQSMGLKASVVDNGASIKKVNFYSGLNLIGSSTKSPYQTVWENLPSGSYVLWASAIDEKGAEVTSGEIDIEVLASVNVPEGDDKSAMTPLPSNGIYYNTTVNDSYEYKSKEFVKTPQGLLKTSGTNITTNTTVSKDKLFQKGRFAGTLAYAIPVPNGTYTVETYHMETYFGKSGRVERAGQRVFDISLEGKVVKKDLDMFLENGNKETVLTFNNIVVTDGILNIELVASANNATISGLAIVGTSVKEDAAKVQTPAANLYFNTTVNESYNYKTTEFVKIPQGHLKTSGTNITTNTTVSKDKLFQKGRFAGTLTYAIPVPNGTYTVETYHMETYFGKSGRVERAGQRVFDISLEGKVVKKDLDMFLENGNKETVLTFKNIVVKDGILNIDLVASANNATISGIAIVGTSVKEDVAKVQPPAANLYFNTTVNDSYKYKSKEFVKIPKGHLKTSGTNITTNTTVSKDKLFQKGRFAGTLAYSIPVPNGTYTVETYHMETYFGKSGRVERAGQRVFDISLEGKVVKKNLDMFLENGNKETVLTFNNIVVTDGILNIDLAASANNATISGIAIKSESSGSTANLRTTSPETAMVEEEGKSSTEVGGGKILLYPNPATTQTTLAVTVEVSSIIIHNMSGQMISNLDPQMLKSNRGEYTIPLSNLTQGLYMVTLVGNNGIIDRLKLLVNN